MRILTNQHILTSCLLIVCLIRSVINDNNPQAPVSNDPDVQAVFAVDENERSLQRKFTIIVNQKAEDCYFITNVREKRTLNIHFMVITYTILASAV